MNVSTAERCRVRICLHNSSTLPTRTDRTHFSCRRLFLWPETFLTQSLNCWRKRKSIFNILCLFSLHHFWPGSSRTSAPEMDQPLNPVPLFTLVNMKRLRKHRNHVSCMKSRFSPEPDRDLVRVGRESKQNVSDQLRDKRWKSSRSVPHPDPNQNPETLWQQLEIWNQENCLRVSLKNCDQNRTHLPLPAAPVLEAPAGPDRGFALRGSHVSASSSSEAVKPRPLLPSYLSLLLQPGSAGMPVIPAEPRLKPVSLHWRNSSLTAFKVYFTLISVRWWVGGKLVAMMEPTWWFNESSVSERRSLFWLVQWPSSGWTVPLGNLQHCC